MKKFLLYLYLILMVYSQPLLAAEESILKSFEYTEGGGNSDIDFSQTKKEVPTKITLIDDSHDWLKDYIDGVSYSVDSFFVDTFFGDDVIDDEISGTRAKLSFFTREKLVN